MNIVTTIEEAEAIDLTHIIRTEGIVDLKTWPGDRISIEIIGGWFGVGSTVGEALAKAKAHTDNVKRVPITPEAAA